MNYHPLPLKILYIATIIASAGALIFYKDFKPRKTLSLSFPNNTAAAVQRVRSAVVEAGYTPQNFYSDGRTGLVHAHAISFRDHSKSQLDVLINATKDGIDYKAIGKDRTEEERVLDRILWAN